MDVARSSATSALAGQRMNTAWMQQANLVLTVWVDRRVIERKLIASEFVPDALVMREV